MRLEYAFRMKKNNVRSRLMKDMKMITKDFVRNNHGLLLWIHKNMKKFESKNPKLIEDLDSGVASINELKQFFGMFKGKHPLNLSLEIYAQFDENYWYYIFNPYFDWQFSMVDNLIKKLPDMEKFDCDFTDPEYIERLKKWKEVIGVDDNYVDIKDIKRNMYQYEIFSFHDLCDMIKDQSLGYDFTKKTFRRALIRKIKE